MTAASPSASAQSRLGHGVGRGVGQGVEDELEQLWCDCLAYPGRLPPDFEPVQSRLLRAVGRAERGELGLVYAKLMAFPRAKDRLRYAFRQLPGPHEGQLLAKVAATGLACPEALLARGVRRLGRPHLSLLVTRALDSLPESPPVQGMAELALGLCQAGIYHPDLNAGNFLLLRDGRVAVLDFQSARLRRGPLGDRDRLLMAAKLLSDRDRPEEQVAALVSSTLLRQGEVDEVLGQARRIRQLALLGRIRRCQQESTLFSVTHGLLGTLYRRRETKGTGTWVEGGPELVRYWIGDRSLEVLEGKSPILGALERSRLLFPRKNRLCVLGEGLRILHEFEVELRRGHERYLELLAGAGGSIDGNSKELTQGR